MTEEEAREWVRHQFGEAADRLLSRYADMLVAEAGRQNLIAPSTLPLLWTRHLVDSLQLVALADGADLGSWIDVGSGAGLPGMAVAVVNGRRTVLVEPRTRRATFLRDVATALSLKNVEVVSKRIELVQEQAAVLSARAVAALSPLLSICAHCTTPSTRWLLPRGGSLDTAQVLDLKREWTFMFHVEQSLVAEESRILVLNGVSRR